MGHMQEDIRAGLLLWLQHGQNAIATLLKNKEDLLLAGCKETGLRCWVYRKCYRFQPGR